jgi:hypothetical protein
MTMRGKPVGKSCTELCEQRTPGYANVNATGNWKIENRRTRVSDGFLKIIICNYIVSINDMDF